MKKLMLAAVAVVGVALTAAEASASGCSSPFCQGPGAQGGLGLFRKQPLPAFQAAPWYLYWPYNAHFMTPSPLQGPYYAPPPVGGGMVNPYFPAQYPVPPVGLAPAVPAVPAYTPAP